LKQYLIYCFLVLLGMAAIALALDWKTAYFLLKFSLMPILIIGLLHSKRDKAEKNWRVILAGLITSWAGDVLLLFSTDRQIFFILGLVCFLFTHIAYIIYFSRYHNGVVYRMLKNPLIGAIIILYALLLISFLWPYLNTLLIPVILYTLIITMMILQAWSAKQYLARTTGILFVVGAVAFVLSDTLLAIDKFYQPFYLSGSLIILTYGIAQLLIVNAAIKNSDASIEAINYENHFLG
jgi:uncharacterized membrane protein YhhN